MRLALVTSVVGLAVAAALATSGQGADPSSVTCESIIDPAGSTEWRPKRVVLGVVAVPPAFIPQTVPTGQARWPFWSKAGLVVRADSPPVTVSVPKRWRHRVAVGWGDVHGSAILRIATCPASSSLGRWNPYAGGFQLRARAACVPLGFTVSGRSATVRFGIGKRC